MKRLIRKVFFRGYIYASKLIYFPLYGILFIFWKLYQKIRVTLTYPQVLPKEQTAEDEE